MDQEIKRLESEASDMADRLTDPDITPEEYAALSTEYITLKRKISSLKIERFLDGV
jgi:SMC interacting uncharacterized protein involved in chromosome segregation